MYRAANVEGNALWGNVDHSGVEVVVEVEWLFGAKTMQKRKKIGAARTGG